MSGHSKWSTIKHKKARTDAVRGKLFSKATKEIIMAAHFGADPNDNSRLRAAISSARSVNLPKDNIERAIKKGSGEHGGENYFDILYEGYGAGGTAVLVKVLTDNKNRSASSVRSTFSKRGGNLGADGCVSYLFTQTGLILVAAENCTEDQLMEITLDAGVEDIKLDDDTFLLTCGPSDLEAVEQALRDAKIEPQSAKVEMIPSTTVMLDESDAKKVLRMMDEFDDNDDVQDVYTNFDIPNSILSTLT